MRRLVGEVHLGGRAGSALIALAFLILVGAGLSCSAAASDVELYLAVNGNDANDGLAPSRPLATLQRAHDLLAQRLASQPARAVVHVAPGRYHGQRCAGAFRCGTI